MRLDINMIGSELSHRMKTDEKNDIHDRAALLMLDTVVEAICTKTPKPKIELDDRLGKYRIQVEGEDQGRLIGTGGMGFWALNAIAYHAGGRRILVEEPKVRWTGGKPIPKTNPNWDRALFKAIVQEVVETCCGTGHDRILQETGETSASLSIILRPIGNLQEKWTREDASLPEAFPIIFAAIGKADGAIIKTEVTFE